MTFEVENLWKLTLSFAHILWSNFNYDTFATGICFFIKQRLYSRIVSRKVDRVQLKNFREVENFGKNAKNCNQQFWLQNIELYVSNGALSDGMKKGGGCICFYFVRVNQI